METEAVLCNPKIVRNRWLETLTPAIVCEEQKNYL